MGGKVENEFEDCWGELFFASVGTALLDAYGYVKRQFHRLVEMLIILHLDPADLRAERAFRLQVKERLYRFNYVSHTNCL